MKDKSEFIDEVLNQVFRYGLEVGKLNKDYQTSNESVDAKAEKATLLKAFREVEIEGALFALDNETLWQYQRKCNAGEASKANRAWIINLLESNISNYKAELTEIKEKEDE